MAAPGRLAHGFSSFYATFLFLFRETPPVLKAGFVAAKTPSGLVCVLTKPYILAAYEVCSPKELACNFICTIELSARDAYRRRQKSLEVARLSLRRLVGAVWAPTKLLGCTMFSKFTT